MTQRPHARRMLTGLIAAAVIGIGLVVLCEAIHAIVRGSTFTIDDGMATRAMIAALPFAILALFGILRRATWLTALTVALAFWGFYLVQTLYPGPDANIGLGLLMMASPLPILVAALIVERLSRRR